MMKEKIIKFLRNPLHYLRLNIRQLKGILLFPFYKIIYKDIGFYCYISSKSSVLNYANISLGKKVFINPFVTIWPVSLQIGNNVQINPGTSIYGTVIIGDNVMIAPNCMIVGGNHGFQNNNVPMIEQKSTEKGIIIEDDVWIGANCVVLDGVRIAKGSVIGAGAVVTRDTEPYSINLGSPSKMVKIRA